MVEDLRDRIDALAASSSFSGLVAVDQPDGTTVRAHGEADRAHDIANTPRRGSRSRAAPKA
jgi:hypothetical protein